MNSLKKKILAGILSGAIIFSGGLAVNSAQAAENSVNQQQRTERSRHERPQMTDEQRAQHVKEFAERYGINQSEIEAALKNRTHFEDIKNAAILSKISGKPFTEVLEMKNDWRQVAEKLGVTRDQIENFRNAEMTEGLAKRAKLDIKTVESLLSDNYDPRDITIAGLIADASGKNVKSVFAKRKINNSWEDVAKEFNVDFSKIAKHERGKAPNFDKD